MKNILWLLVVIAFSNCNDKKEIILETATKVKGSNSSIQKTDTSTVEKYRLKDNQRIKINKDSIFFVKGLPLKMNDIKCYWEYKVNKVGQEDQYGNNIKILDEILRIESSDKILFQSTNEVNNADNLMPYKTIYYMKTHQISDLECEDIDLDGYCDFKILIERAAAGANETYDVYLFNPKNKKFEFSKVFSGTNPEYDKEKNRLSFMWKMGARSYSFGYINLKKNRREIEFVEEIQQEQDTIIYTKSIHKKIIKRKRVVLKKEEWQGDEVHAEDSQYLLERNKK